jgi:hypothetical protein
VDEIAGRGFVPRTQEVQTTMSRKLFTAAIALALAGGVYFTGSPAEASNMGFKLERSFNTIDGFKGLYYVSFPLFNGLGDVADTTMPGPNGPNGGVCDTSVRGGDGIINAHDALCDMWQSRTGNMSMVRFDEEACTFQPETLEYVQFLNTVVSTNTWTDPLIRDEGFQVNVPFSATDGPLDNRAVIVGSHDPSYAGKAVQLPISGCSPNVSIINLPYHTMYQSSVELLCGLKDVDWFDADSNGEPDTCPNGVFDEFDGAAGGALISVVTFDNVNDANGTDNTFVNQSVEYVTFLGGNVFTGSEYDLTPGDAYVVRLTPNHRPTVFLSPHF